MTDMAHDHNHKTKDWNRAFALGVALNFSFVVTEAVFGFMAGSLALLADAGHNLGDVIGLLLAWGATYLSQQQATQRHTYGWRSSSILAALFNAVILLVAVGGITWEAVRRLFETPDVAGMTVVWVASVGVIINTGTALLFMSGHKNDLNIRGAFLHMAADAGVSGGVVVAGLCILGTGWQWIDPAISLLIAAVILFSTWGLLRGSANLALNAVPAGIDPAQVENYLRSLPGVKGVHDLHIWGLSTTEAALTAHLVKPDPRDDDELIALATRELHERFGIEHPTLQWERHDNLPFCEVACEKNNT